MNSRRSPSGSHASFELCRISVEPEGERWSSWKLEAGSISKSCQSIVRRSRTEGGGSIVFGVTDRRPRRVVGTNAFEEPGRTVAGLSDRLPCTISHDGVRGLRLHPGYPDEIQFSGSAGGPAFRSSWSCYWELLGTSVRFESAQPIERIVKEDLNLRPLGYEFASRA